MGAHSYKRTLDGDTAWRGRAACRDEDPALFFPTDTHGVVVAQRICADCPVQGQCLEYAITNRQDAGVWGNTSERERRRIIKQRREQVA